MLPLKNFRTRDQPRVHLIRYNRSEVLPTLFPLNPEGRKETTYLFSTPTWKGEGDAEKGGKAKPGFIKKKKRRLSLDFVNKEEKSRGMCSAYHSTKNLDGVVASNQAIISGRAATSRMVVEEALE
ncbi:hypothetical protein CEXT_458371 [Caerostris extrusa]|uniref:Uncharacterized protein n=1 Tax=Caerostris extrusa TaxID=172846 RepID=A0AAV4V3T6_CAEEX|nr:hypothetical protein CEXT_458371 [Caerostris extrusa]